MAEEGPKDSGGNQVYYLLGAVVFVGVVVAGYFWRSKINLLPTVPLTTPVAATPTPGPISGLSCEKQYYNPVLGFAKYYLSVEGGDISAATKVNCSITVSVDNKVVASESATSPLTPAPQRGGATFRCTSNAVALEPSVPTKVDYQLKDDLGKTASCSYTFLLPTP